ncbi:MAG: hypothetical protein LBU87_06530 [Lactobacillales bacterium]|jgi:hypothetical protein|nr:hypothetical protein [Lactobacillales bacterium]
MLFKFYTDEAGEYDILKNMLSGWSGSTVAQRARQYGIPMDIARTCKKTKECPLLKEYLRQGYKTYAVELKQSLAFYTAYWKKREKEIRALLEKIFETKVPLYTVRLNVQCDGTSNWYGTDISINAFSYLFPNKNWHACSVLWEMVLSLTFMAVRRLFPASELPDEQVWGIAELTAIAFIQVDFEKGSDWTISYKELEPHRRKVRRIYQRRKNWDDYLHQVIRYFKQHPLKKGC